MTLVQERERTQLAVEEVDKVEEVEEAVSAGRAEAALKAAQSLKRNVITQTPPVRLSVAAELLGISVPTARAWADEGILELRGESPQRVSFGSVVRVRPIIRELKRQGQNRDLLAMVIARLEDQETLEDELLIRSLEEMRAGKRVRRRGARDEHQPA